MDVAVELGTEDASNAIVYMHGAGGSGDGAIRYAGTIPKDTIMYGVNGPHRIWENGYLWSRQIKDDQVVPEVINKSIDMLYSFIEELKKKHENVMICGFSQGGTMAVTYPLVYPGSIDHIVSFSGYIAAHVEIPVEAKSTKFLIVHGYQDYENPHWLAMRGVEKLQEKGIEPEVISFQGGHRIPPNIFQRGITWWTNQLQHAQRTR